MEPSQLTGDGGEGCNSSESGWTMYLVSPMHDDGGDDDDDGKASGNEGSSVDDGDYGRRIDGKEEEEDDDSLASDASTGPAQVKKVPSMADGNGGKSHAKNDDDDGKAEKEGGLRARFSTSSWKKAGKPEKGGEGKSSRRGLSKRGSSSRTSFFW